jgi:RNA polymerase sigma factor (sigma-70 family)
MSTTPETLYEQTLVLRSQLGDEAAFEELLELHGPRLLLFAQRMLQSSPESVADVTQEIWVAIYRALPRLLDASKFRPWTFRIARDRIYREYRRRKLPVQLTDDAQLFGFPSNSKRLLTIPCPAAAISSSRLDMNNDAENLFGSCLWYPGHVSRQCW